MNPEALRAAIGPLLDLLYGERSADVADDVVALAERYAGRLGAVRHRHDQATAYLITYGGAVRRPGETPLHTLASVLRQMANRPNEWLAGNQRPTYNDYMAYNQAGTPENEVWIYTSCESYGCDESTDPYWNGWAGYAIDAPPSHARAMGWLSYTYGASAELFWNTMMRLDTAWTNQYESGFNGDGTFFYAGLPEGGNGAPAIGGQHGIPIESLRLKRIRDGREDYELMRMLGARGRGGTARNIITGLLGDADHASFGATVSAAAFENSRCRLFEELVGPDACEIP